MGRFRKFYLKIAVVLCGASVFSYLCMIIGVVYDNSSKYPYVKHRQLPFNHDTTGCKANHSVVQADEMVKKFREIHKPKRSIYYLDEDEPYMKLIKRLKLFRKRGLLLGSFLNIPGNSSWQRFQRNINQYYLYDPDQDNIVADLLKDLSKRPIVAAKSKTGTSHLALHLTFDDGSKGIFKAMRTPKHQESAPNSFHFSDIERPTAEIAAFHLDM
ncbi:uncharacterized protein LOC131949688 [Physella acuta]|uniref:uncharacterized protein LOC131949688 n=1 Tax=Physella acuta TaxID=109671 RepID=UPI0027DC427C|nr:uncharacterized protein LOC131949688 [Physella acuta]